MLKKLILLSFVVSSINAGDSNTVQEKTHTFMENHFLYISGGTVRNKIDYKLSPGDTFSKGALDETGNLFEAGVGYRFNENTFSTVSYQRENFDLLQKNNYLLSINYQSRDFIFNPFIGIVGGYSRLKWEQPPYTLQPDNDFTSSSVVFGSQVGVEYFFNDTTSVFSKYQFLTNDHKMNIKYDTNTIEHKNNQNLQLGVRYEF